MSWCGGGEMSGTPGTECRRRAISAVTLCPGSCPPSPGFEPWAILISSSSARIRYCVVTPKRADATCLIRLSARSALASGALGEKGLVSVPLRRRHDRRRPAVVLAIATVAHPPVVRQHARRGLLRRVGRVVAGEHVLRDLREPDPADGGHRSRETGIDHLGAQPQGLEDLAAAIRRQGRDPHLGDDLEEALFGRGAKLQPGFTRRGTWDLRRSPVLSFFREDRTHGLEGE